MHLKLSGKLILRKFLLSREFSVDFKSGPRVDPFLGVLDIGQFHSPQIKLCKSADYFMKVSFHIKVDMRQGESNIFQISTWKAFLLYIYYEKSDRLRKKGANRSGSVPSQLSSSWISNNWPLSGWITLGTSDCESRTFFIMNFLNFLRWKSKSWKTTVWDSIDSNKTGMGFALSRN